MPGLDIYDAVRAHIEASWATTAIAFENEDPAINLRDGTAPWVFIEFASSVYEQQSIGAHEAGENRWDEDGTVFLHVMVRTGRGVRDAYAYARALADLFRGVTLMGDRLEFMDATIGFGGPGDEEGNWYRISVNQGWRLVDA